jgi:hypothetical protein
MLTNVAWWSAVQGGKTLSHSLFVRRVRTLMYTVSMGRKVAISGESQESPHIGGHRGLRPGGDVIGFLGLGFNPYPGDDVSEEAELCGKEVKLGLVAVDAGFAEGLENGSAVPFVFLHGLRPDDDVVEIYMANFADKIS